MSLLPLLEEPGGQQLEEVIPHLIIADKQPLGPGFHCCIHPVPEQACRQFRALLYIMQSVHAISACNQSLHYVSSCSAFACNQYLHQWFHKFAYNTYNMHSISAYACRFYLAFACH